MRKSLIVAVAVLCIGFAGYKIYAAAGTQYNWGTQNGGSWVTPDDSKTTVGQVLQIGSAGGAIVVAGGAPTTLFGASSTTIAGLTPGSAGQLVFETSGTTAPSVCVSTGVTIGSFVLVQTTTTVCK